MPIPINQTSKRHSIPAARRQTRWSTLHCKSHFANIFMGFVCGCGRGVCVVRLCIVQFFYLRLDKRSQQANKKQQEKKKWTISEETKKKNDFLIIARQMTSDPDLNKWSHHESCLFARISHFKLNWLCRWNTTIWSQQKETRNSNTDSGEERACCNKNKIRNKNEVRKTVRITVHLIKLIYVKTRAIPYMPFTVHGRLCVTMRA